MLTTIKKTTVVLAAILTIGLTSGNALLAEDRAIEGVISAADLAFIETGYSNAGNGGATADRLKPAGLLSAEDFAFIRSPFSELSFSYRARRNSASVGIITAADYRFVAGEQSEDIFSVYSDLADSLAGQPAR